MWRTRFLRLALVFLALSLVLGAVYAGAQQQSATETPAATAAQPKTTAEEAPAAVEQPKALEAAAEQQPRADRAQADASKSQDDDIRAQRSHTRGLGMRAITQAQRVAAAERAKARGTEAERRGLISRAPVGGAGGVVPTGAALYFGVSPNFANSPLPQVGSGGAITGGIRKFVDSLPGLGAWNCVKNAPADPLSCHENNLGNFIPVVKPAAGPTGGYTSFNRPDDYYEIGLKDYTQKLHSDLPATSLRGYYDKNSGDAQPHYLGPVIIAKMNKPVRLKFSNELLTGSHLQLPIDFTAMGAGNDPDGRPYSQNRAVIHLHGGATPWISDGTPHQWLTPAGDGGNTKKGVSFQNVPDMVGAGLAVPDNTHPGDGLATYYYANQQPNRLMFFHDHSYGITRLNVYGGEAAGYLLWDQWERDLIEGTNVGDSVAPGGTPVPLNINKAVLPGNGAGLYEFGIPLVIQDKTFVPPIAQLQAEDPTWDTTLWGSTGNLWFPHVYMTNQNPADIEGVAPMGRWDYGPWFWPAQDPATLKGAPTACGTDTLTQQLIYCPGTPTPTQVPESFSDTPLVNGAAYPYLTVQKKAYRFRILNAANDRTMNLQIYYAADKNTISTVTPTVCNGTGAAPGNCTEVKMVPAEPHAAIPTPPATLNPPGISTAPPACPAATDVKNNIGGLSLGNLDATGTVLNGTGFGIGCWPSNWPTDGRDGGVPDPTTAGPAIIQIGTEGGWLPQPVVIPSTPVNYNYNRRDIVVLNIANHGLLVGPAERADIVVDFSQVPDGSTLILYNDGPAPDPGTDPRFDYYTGAPDFTSTGGAPSTLPGYGPNTRTIMQFRVSGGGDPAFNVQALKPAMAAYFKAAQPTPIVGNADYEAVYNPTYSFSTPAPTFKSGYSRVQDNTLTWFPIDYSTGAQSTVRSASQGMGPKAIHELFDDRGRMNSILGTELPFTNFQTQTTVPLTYVDPPTEFLTDGTPQIWKITHNGVDTHAIHFHLFNVQLINRVGWDGAIRRPDDNEVGWKETVRMNPLEDAIVAFLPKSQLLPFGIPNSVRLLDPTMPEGPTDNNMSGLDPVTGNANPALLANKKFDFGWEYVWHCHLLGHEENDMMRPMVLRVVSLAPAAPTVLTATAVTTPSLAVNLSWTAPTGTPAVTSYQVQRALGALGAFATVYNSAGTGTPLATTWQDTAVSAGQSYRYQVLAAAGLNLSPPSNIATATFQLTAPANFRANAVSRTSLVLTWNAVPNATFYLVQRANNPGFTGTVVTTPTAGTTLPVAGLTPGATYYFRVQATNAVPAASSTFTTLAGPVTMLP